MKIIRPDKLAEKIYDIDVKELKEMGKKIIFLDLDNTIVPYKKENLSEETISWINNTKNEGLEIFILSNATVSRVNKIKSMLNIEGEGQVFKPILRSISRIIKKKNYCPSQVVLIGDQIFTDVLLGRREKVYTILVKPSSDKDFIFTKITRFLESIVRRFLYAEKA